MFRRHSHPSEISCLRAGTQSAVDLLAVGGEHHLEILHQDPSFDELQYIVLFSVYIGSRITSIAWSSRSQSPRDFPDTWFVELAIACIDSKLRLVTCSAGNLEPSVKVFGTEQAGHRGIINDICFCTAETEKAKYLASVSDDKNCILWDLYPAEYANPDFDFEDPPSPTPAASGFASQQPVPPQTDSSSPSNELKCTIYQIAFDHQLHSVCSHPANARCIMVSDAAGTVSLINWMDALTALTSASREDGLGPIARSGAHRVSAMIDPAALARSVTGVQNFWGGGASWKTGDPDLFGATYGPKWTVWNQKRLQGGKPFLSGEGFPKGGHRFRWCPTNPRLFAISTTSPASGALIKVFDLGFPKAPRSFTLLPRPHRVRDFDWLGAREGVEDVNDPAWMAVAVGNQVICFSAGAGAE